MLYITFATRDKVQDKMNNFIYKIDSYFDNNYLEEWFDDEFVKDMVLDVDKSEVISPYLVISPKLGSIPVTKISGGVKNLITMYKEPDIVTYASNCGNNCSKWIIEIAKKQDIRIVLGYPMEFYGRISDVEVFITNSNKYVRDDREYILECLSWL